MPKKKSARMGVRKLPEWVRKKKCPRKKMYLSGKRILPKGITGKEKLSYLVEETFLAYNSARLREACQLFATRMLEPDVMVGISLSGALTPAGLGCSCIVPLIKAGFVDWIVSTGANLYHDTHFPMGLPLYVGSPFVNDVDLRKNDVVRIYDVFFPYSDGLLDQDKALQDVLLKPEFQKEMGTAEFHYLLGKCCDMWACEHSYKDVSILTAAFKAKVPIYASAPGDSSLGMNVAGAELTGSKLRINPSLDVNETAAIVLGAKRAGGKSAVLVIGGGTPKNFVLQTEPHIQEILRINESGHDYFIQITDSRPDTGGLSGATPREAVTWGKIDPERVPDAVVCYVDATIALPILTHYALANHRRRPYRRLYDTREELVAQMKEEFLQAAQKEERPTQSRKKRAGTSRTRRA